MARAVLGHRARSFRSDSQLAIDSQHLKSIMILGSEASEHALSRLERRFLHFHEDLPEIEIEAAEDRPEGSVPVGEDALLFSFEGRTILVDLHRGSAGSLTLDELWSTTPLWKRLAAVHEPEPELVEALRDWAEPVTLDLFFGTWCGDSRNFVPKLLAALEAADNPRLELRLTAIGRGFTDPLDQVQLKRVTNVPTLIVRRGDEEIGRFVETPTDGTIVDDLLAILYGELGQHPGRYDRESLLLEAHYRTHFADGAIGSEHWQLWQREDGGRLSRSRSTRTDGTTEFWVAYKKNGNVDFLELTRWDGQRVARTRGWPRDGKLSLTTRGSDTGIVRRMVSMPSTLRIEIPGFAASYWNLRSGEQVSWILSSDGGGRVRTYGLTDDGAHEIATPAGRIQTSRLLRDDGTILQIGLEAGVPVRIEYPDGTVSTLESIARSESVDRSARLH